MEDLRSARVIARTYFPEFTDERLNAVIGNCTGHPDNWPKKHGSTPEQCFRHQLMEARRFYDQHGMLPDLDDDMDAVYPGSQA